MITQLFNSAVLTTFFISTRLFHDLGEQGSCAPSLRNSFLAWLDSTVVDGSQVSTSNHSVGRKIAVQDREQLKGAGAAAPVTHELTDDSKIGYDVDSSFAHTVIGLLSDIDRGCTRCLMVCPYTVSGFAKGECAECSTYCFNRAQSEKRAFPVMVITP